MMIRKSAASLPLFEQTEDLPGKTFPTLYTLDSRGKLRSWQISVEPRCSGFAVKTLFGLVEGSKVPNEYLISKGTNIGRANETTAFDQAMLEAESKWKQQIRAGYCERAEDCRANTLGSGIPAPMLAQKYSPDGKLAGSRTLEKMKLVGERIYVQPKLDGIRCLARVTRDSVELYSRKGDPMQPVPHVERQLREAYDFHFEGLDIVPGGAEFILDGELYTSAMTFNALSGLLRREDKSPADYELLEQVGYHIYDLMHDSMSYPARLRVINQYFHLSPTVRAVESYEIEAADAEIRRFMEKFLKEGYEGLMIRRLDTPYEYKRSWSLCKYKDFQDAEYKLVDIVEDVRGGGVIGAFVLEIEVSGERRTFNAGIKDLSHDESRRILANKADYIGRYATVEFFQLSEFGIPRFPKLKGFRNDV